MGKPADWYDLVSDRPGHDLRYAIDSTKLRDETGWEPRYRDIRAGLEQTIAWYRTHEDWWRGPRRAPRRRTPGSGASGPPDRAVVCDVRSLDTPVRRRVTAPDVANDLVGARGAGAGMGRARPTTRAAARGGRRAAR